MKKSNFLWKKQKEYHITIYFPEPKKKLINTLELWGYAASSSHMWNDEVHNFERKENTI